MIASSAVYHKLTVRWTMNLESAELYISGRMLNIQRLRLGFESYRMKQHILWWAVILFRHAGAYESTAGLVDLQRVIGFVALTSNK